MGALGAVVGKLPGAGRAAADGGEDFIHIQPHGAGVGDGLADAGQRAGDGDLVGHLRVLAAAGRAHIANAAAHGLENGNGALKGLAVAADHDGQCAGARARVAAGNGGVQRQKALRRGLGIDALRQARAGGGHVDDQRAGAGVGKYALIAEIDFLHVRGKAHDADNRVRVAHAIRDVLAPDRAGVQRLERLGARARIGVDFIALLQKVFYHAVAHDSHADKADLHPQEPPRCPGAIWKMNSPPTGGFPACGGRQIIIHIV